MVSGPPALVWENPLPQDLGHRRLSGSPPPEGLSNSRNHERRGCSRPANSKALPGAISGPETAFVVTHDRPNARAAQSRPGAEHRARPVLPEPEPNQKERAAVLNT